MESPYLESQGLQLTWDKIFIVRDENGARVETRTFFSLPFDLILALFVKELEALYEWKPGMSGMQPYSPIAAFKAILYTKLNKNMSDRELDVLQLRKQIRKQLKKVRTSAFSPWIVILPIAFCVIFFGFVLLIILIARG